MHSVRVGGDLIVCLYGPGLAVINSTRALLSTGDDPKTDGPGEDHSAKMSAVF